MTPRFWLLGLVTFVCASPAFAVIERLTEKTFAATAGVEIKASTFSGSISVVPSETDEVHIRVRHAFDGDDEKAADAQLAKIDIAIAQSKDGVTLEIKYRNALRWAWETWPPAAIAVEIKAPRTCRLDLRTREGGITVGAMAGVVVARTLSGPVFIGEFEGAVTASSERGDVSVTACTGELKIETGSGNLLVGRAGARAELRGKGGAIEVQRASGAVIAEGDGADLKVGFVHPVFQASELHASGGDVIVNFDPRSACTIDAGSSRWSTVRVRALPLAITKGGDGTPALSATLNGGGPAIKIRASGGGVRLNGVPAAPDSP